MQVVIYREDNNRVWVLFPAPEFADQIEYVAQKDVPAGRPWRIVDDSGLPPYDIQDRWLWTESGSLDVIVQTQEELDAAAADTVRAERNQKLLSEVDPVVTNPLRWADLTAEKQAEWAAYRRALLDVTAQSGFPHSVVWPTKPE
jgi:hypothetical protein